MEYKFSIQIDDENHSLSSIKGISIKYIWELLRDLYKSIDIEEDANCTLSSIRGNCYALDFSTEEEQHLERFKIVHKNIQELSEFDLSPEEKNYAKTLKKILGSKYFLKAYDNDRNVIATIQELDKEKAITTYYINKTIYGYVSELGGKSLNTEKKHIKMDGFPYNISISKDLDLKLKQFYRTQKLRIKIRAKLSTENNRIINAEMINFEEVGKNNLSQNIKELGYVDIDLIKNISTIDDIIDKLYANKD